MFNTIFGSFPHTNGWENIRGSSIKSVVCVYPIFHDKGTVMQNSL